MSIQEIDINSSPAALVPFYGSDGGNATKVYTLNGKITEDKRTIRWIIRRIARAYSIDLEALRHNTGNHLSISQGVPLPLAPHLVLVPLKMRRTIGENDGTGGYINYYAVEKVTAINDTENKDSEEENGFRSKIILKGGEVIPCLFTLKTLKRRLNTGKLAAETLFYSGKINLSRNYPHALAHSNDYSMEERCEYITSGPPPGMVVPPIPPGLHGSAGSTLTYGSGCPFATSCHNKYNHRNDNKQSR